jgi:hypothetical protein
MGEQLHGRQPTSVRFAPSAPNCGQVNRCHAGLISHASGVRPASPQPVLRGEGSRPSSSTNSPGRPLRSRRRSEKPDKHVRLVPLAPGVTAAERLRRQTVYASYRGGGARSPVSTRVRFSPVTPCLALRAIEKRPTRWDVAQLAERQSFFRHDDTAGSGFDAQRPSHWGIAKMERQRTLTPPSWVRILLPQPDFSRARRPTERIERYERSDRGSSPCGRTISMRAGLSSNLDRTQLSEG